MTRASVSRLPATPRWVAGRLAWLVGPLAAWVALELAVLPIDAFTFRAWEALVVKSQQANLPGPFYPDRELELDEAGDQDPTGPRDRRVRWRTDRFGYRNETAVAERPVQDVVLVGDSHIAGSRLSQPETLAVRLEAMTGWRVYNHGFNGAVDLARLLGDPRFDPRRGGAAPGVVVFELRPVDVDLGMSRLPAVSALLSGSEFGAAGGAAEAWVLLDRLRKLNSLQWIRARLRVRLPGSPPGPTADRYPEAAAAVGAGAPISERAAAHAASILMGYAAAVRDRLGCEMGVLLMADRMVRPSADDLVRRLEEAGVPLIDLRRGGPDPFFFPRDSHWRPASVQWAAQRLAAAVPVWVGPERLKRFGDPSTLQPAKVPLNAAGP